MCVIGTILLNSMLTLSFARRYGDDDGPADDNDDDDEASEIRQLEGSPFIAAMIYFYIQV